MLETTNAEALAPPAQVPTGTVGDKKKAPLLPGSALNNPELDSISSIRLSDAGASEPVAKETILDEIVNHLSQYVVIKDLRICRLIALWVIATHLHESFEYMGYLFIHSPEMSSGKTTLLKHLDSLVYNSTGVSCSPTEAVLFRSAEKHTQLLDESDGWDNADTLRRVLNSGFQRNGSVQRCEQNSSGAWVVKPYIVYGPKAIAGIGKDIFRETTKARTFFIELMRKKKTEKTKRRRTGIIPGEAELKQKIEQWVKSNKPEALRVYGSLNDATFPYLDHFTDRTQDVSEPLAAILEVMFSKNSRLDDERRMLVDAIALARNESNSQSDQLRILIELEKMMDKMDLALIEPPSVLADKLNTQGMAVTEGDVSRALVAFGFKKQSVRKEGQPRYCYVIEREKLRDVIDRYGAGADPRDPQSDVLAAAEP
jgi:hypothetical protein